MMERAHHVIMLATAGAFAAAWLVYFRWKNRVLPKRATALLLAALLGVLSVIPALAGLAGLDVIGRGPSWAAMAGGSAFQAMRSSLVIGLAEETAKLLPVLTLAMVRRRFNALLDGPIYAAAAGVGFSWAETLLLCMAGELDLLHATARAATAPVTHALFAAIWGVGVSEAVLRRRVALLPISFAASVGLHAGYDLIIARSGVPAAAALLIAAVWAWFIVLAARWSRPTWSVRDRRGERPIARRDE